jgi:hypothetical protein
MLLVLDITHGVCEQCYPRTAMERISLPIDPTITTTSEREIGAGGDPKIVQDVLMQAR